MRSTPLRFACLGLLAAVLAACAGEDDTSSATTSPATGTTTEGPLPGPEEWNRDVTPPADDEAAQKRAACAYKKGSLPAETQGARTQFDRVLNGSARFTADCNNKNV